MSNNPGDNASAQNLISVFEQIGSTNQYVAKATNGAVPRDISEQVPYFRELTRVMVFIAQDRVNLGNTRLADYSYSDLANTMKIPYFGMDAEQAFEFNKANSRRQSEE
ncbi:MAG: hypothetical protein Q8O89_03250 [Nanoarchaeota archaeon]|nr:hypothetical protein [Nanoarchaeota archaeon]